MSAIPPLTTLRAEDFPPEQRTWLPRLFQPLNQFLTNASNAINGLIEFGTNIPAQDVALSFTFDGRAQRFRWNYRQPPAVLWVGQVFENGAASEAVPIWSFDGSTSTISVEFRKSSGQELTAAAVYKIFLRIVP